MKLPSYFSLVGTTHLPPVDNQGGIGSCASQSITHNQFSNAVSRYLHSINSSCNRCPRDNASDCFSPKSTYNYAGAGTIWVYEVLEDHGALMVDETIFYKDEKGGSQKFKDGKTIAQSASWCVNPGEMETALSRRMKGYERIWFTQAPYKERLTTCKAGLKLLERIKKSVVDGNPVITGGYPARWVYAKIDTCGNLGKMGEETVVAAAGNSGGGHQVTIVGYDDDITCTFAGVTMKGALLIKNSYGEGWKNKGYTWMMYDSLNTASEYAELNNPALYSGPMYVTPANMSMFPPALTDKNQTLTLHKVSSVTIAGKEYDSYSLFDKSVGQYVSYTKEKENRKVFLSDNASAWVFLPYEDLKNLPDYKEEYYKEEYKDSYWLYAVDRDDTEGGMRFLDAGVSYSASGRSLQFAHGNGSRYPEAKSFDVDAIGDCAETRLAISAGKGVQCERNWVLDQFAFTDWTKCVCLRRPDLYAKITITIDDREGFAVVMTRTDKNGNKETYLPALFRQSPHHPTYCKKDEYLTFSGLVNEAPETGYFALSLEKLLELPEGTTADDYVFGMDVIVKDGKTATIEDIALCKEDTTVIFEKEIKETVCGGNTVSYLLK